MSARDCHVAKAFHIGGAKGSPSLVVVIPRAVVLAQGFGSNTIFTIRVDGRRLILQDMSDLLSEQQNKREF